MKTQSNTHFRVLRALSVLFLVALALGAFCIGAGAAEEPAAAKTWNLSASAQDSVFASAYESASSTPDEPRYDLRIFGIGAAKDFAQGGNFEGYPIESVTVENGVTSIGAHTFEGEQWLQRVSLAPSVLTVGDGAFKGCQRLFELSLGAVERIGDEAFEGASSLVSLPLPATLRHLGAEAFKDAAITSVRLPKSLVFFGRGALACPRLASIEVDSECRALVTDRGALYSVGEKGAEVLLAYPAAASLTSFSVKDGAQTVASFAFSYVKTLAEITIPESVSLVEANAFKDCTVRRIAIRATLGEIDENAYSGSFVATLKAHIGSPYGAFAAAGARSGALTAEWICADADRNHKCDICEGEAWEHKASTERVHICAHCNLPVGECEPEEDDGDCTTPVKCKVCSYILTPAAEHRGGTPTCLAKGKCVTCGKEYGDNSFAHLFGTWKKEVAATPFKEGVKAHKTCYLCHKHYDLKNAEITDLSIPRLGTKESPVKPWHIVLIAVGGVAVVGAGVLLTVYIIRRKRR